MLPIPTSWQIGGVLIALLALSGFLLKKSYEANATLKKEKEDAEVARDDLAQKLQTYQQIDRRKDSEITGLRARLDDVVGDFQDWQDSEGVRDCMATPIPGPLADRLRDATSGLYLPDN